MSEVEFVPEDDQLAGIRFIMEKSFGALFYDAGVGKTSTTLWGYKLLRDMGFVNRMLVLSSINILNDVWPPEMEKWAGLDVSYAPLLGGHRKRARNFELDADVYLLNNENLLWFRDNYKKQMKGEKWMLYVDESSKYRNRGTDRFRAMKSLLPYFRRRYVGTATPTPKGYQNLWAQFMIVDRGESLGETLGEFRVKYMRPGGFKGKEWTLREGAEVEIQAAIADRVHRVEKHLEVSINFEPIKVKITGKARKAYDELEREFITEWQGKTLIAANAAVATSKLRQAANGAIYYDRLRNWTKVHTAKVEALQKLLKQLKGKPLLLAYEFDHDYEMLQRAGIRFPSYSRAKKGAPRSELLELWNRGRLPILGGQIGAMSHGLNAQFGGHFLAYYGMTYDLEAVEQFYQRLWRKGQKNDVTAFQIVAEDTVEDTMMDVLRVREHDQKMLLAALKKRYDL